MKKLLKALWLIVLIIFVSMMIIMLPAVVGFVLPAACVVMAILLPGILLGMFVSRKKK